MKLNLTLWMLCLCMSLFSQHSIAQEPLLKPDTITTHVAAHTFNQLKPIRHVNDYGKLFTPAQQTQLSQIITEYQVKTARSIMVLTVDSIAPYQNLLKFAQDWKQHWHTTTSPHNQKLVMVICKPCQQVAVATGEGIGDNLKDEECSEVIKQDILPAYKKEEFFKGTQEGLMRLIEKWN